MANRRTKAGGSEGRPNVSPAGVGAVSVSTQGLQRAHDQGADGLLDRRARAPAFHETCRPQEDPGRGEAFGRRDHAVSGEVHPLVGDEEEPMSAIKANSAAILASGDKALRAVVRVGEGGRGFVVEGRGNERYVVTAAPRLPP